jgi:excisionase family DNA binding protein
MTAQKLLATQEESAGVLGVSVSEIKRLRVSGRIVARKHGRRILIPMSELRRYADSLPVDVPR